MDFRRNIISLFIASRLLAYCSPASILPTSPYYGIHPQDEKYYGSDPINCKDGSKSFSRDHLNDDFCDCLDGTDEPGTSACPDGRFYCRNEESTPQLLFSSRVNDHLCDCCDGSDEYDGSVSCLNTCIRNANLSNTDDGNTRIGLGDINAQKKIGVSLDDLVHKLGELKIVLLLEVAFFMMTFRLFYRHVRSRRRGYR